MDIDMKQYARLASLGAVGVSAANFALYLFLAWVASPPPHGGIDHTQAVIAWVGMACPFALIIAAHLALAKQLANYAKEHSR